MSNVPADSVPPDAVKVSTRDLFMVSIVGDGFRYQYVINEGITDALYLLQTIGAGYDQSSLMTKAL